MKCLLWTQSIMSVQIPLSAQPVIASFVCLTRPMPYKALETRNNHIAGISFSIRGTAYGFSFMLPS